MAAKYYAMTVGCHVLLCASPLTQEIIDYIQEGEPQQGYAPGFGGGGVIFDPDGQILAEADPDTDGMALARIDLEAEVAHHFQLDRAGHYSKPSVAHVVVDRRPQQAVIFLGEAPSYACSYEDIQGDGKDRGDGCRG